MLCSLFPEKMKKKIYKLINQNQYIVINSHSMLRMRNTIVGVAYHINKNIEIICTSTWISGDHHLKQSAT